MRCSDDESHSVSLASLAGAYLALMFPLVAEDLNESLSESIKTEDHAEKHIIKFCLLRFDALVEEVIVPLRALGAHSGRDYALNTIAAAGVLYCEVEHVNQGFQSGKLRLLCVSGHVVAHLFTTLSALG